MPKIVKILLNMSIVVYGVLAILWGVCGVTALLAGIIGVLAASGLVKSGALFALAAFATVHCMSCAASCEAVNEYLPLPPRK